MFMPIVAQYQCIMGFRLQVTCFYHDIKLFITKVPEKNLNTEEVIDYCKKYLTGYKIPKFVEFIDEIPKSNVGKILRRELRKRDNG